MMKYSYRVICLNSGSSAIVLFWKVVETLESGALPQEMNHGDGPGGLIVQHYFLPTPCFLTTHTIWPADAPPTLAAFLLSCGTLFNCDPQSCLYDMCLSS